MIERNIVTSDTSYITSHGDRFDSQSQASYWQAIRDLAVSIDSKMDTSYSSSTVIDIAKCIVENHLDMIKFLESLDD